MLVVDYGKCVYKHHQDFSCDLECLWICHRVCKPGEAALYIAGNEIDIPFYHIGFHFWCMQDKGCDFCIRFCPHGAISQTDSLDYALNNFKKAVIKEVEILYKRLRKAFRY